MPALDELLEGNALDGFDELGCDGVVAKFGRCGWLPLLKPVEGEGGIFAYGSVARGVDGVADAFSDELDGKFDEPCKGRPCDDGG